MKLNPGLKLVGVCLFAALIASAGCRKKTQPATSAAFGPETLTPIAEEDSFVSSGAEVTAPMDDREVTPFGKRVASTLDSVMFKYDSAKLDDSELAKADTVAAFLKDHSAFKVVIEGNCDERGTAEYNMALGERRAQAVRAYLLNVGVPESRIQTLSYGEEKPAAPGHAESDWAKNRRADFAVYE